jgi:hypothetical protein
VVVRADSAFYGAEVIAAARHGGAHLSVTARHDPAVLRATAAIPEQAWVPIEYPNAIYDQDQGPWVWDAEVAETRYTAFTSRPLSQQVQARLIVRRVRRLNTTGLDGQDELLAGYRHHAVFTDSPLTMLQAEAAHRRHAIIEQVHADLRSGPLAHLPSGKFTANAAWLVLPAMAFNLTRAAGSIASTAHANATTGTIRAQLITMPVRLARSARRTVLHAPTGWPWQQAWQRLHAAVANPPPLAF